MSVTVKFVFAVIAALLLTDWSWAQKAPEAGYIFPVGGKAGTTVEVRLGGYDWTPDMEFFVHDKRIQLIPTGPLGPILIPEPPYWFGAKSRLIALPIPREIPAKLVIPADVPPGPIYWQAANANGCTSTGVFTVGNGLEVVEDERRKLPQLLPSVPATVSGRLMKIEEVDRYRFIAPKDGPITCELMARRIGAKFLGILEVRDKQGRLIADASGTNGMDTALTFSARAGSEYVVALHDVDFGGDRSYVYRLSITQGPRVVGAIPAVGRRGETREVEFVGFGVANGTARLESVRRQFTFPKDSPNSSFDYQLETPWGTAPAFPLILSDLPEVVANSPGSVPGDSSRSGPAWITEALGITGVLDQPDKEDRYFCAWKKGDVWSLRAEARRIGSSLDLSLAIVGQDGKELVRNDDLPETTDAGLEFTVPADGTYQILVSDTTGKSNSRSAIYRLSVQHPMDDFELHLGTQRIGVPIGGKFDLAVKVIRKGKFKGPIVLSVLGLPEGIQTHPALFIPADKTDATIQLHAARGMGVTAGFITVLGTSGTLQRKATARNPINLAPQRPEDNHISQVLVASILKARFKGQPVDQDTGRKVHRGATFPAEVIVQRLDGFDGEIVLQMAAQQSYQVQGITGGDVIVPPGVERTLYPCFMPEWLESSRTSRMGMIAVAKVPDPTGKVRHIVAEMTGFITMTVEGALLKLSAEDHDLAVSAGQPIEVHLKVSRLAKLAEPVRLELKVPDELASQVKAEPVTVPVGVEKAVFRVTTSSTLRGTHTFTIRATALQDGKYPAISETSVSVEFLPLATSTR